MNMKTVGLVCVLGAWLGAVDAFADDTSSTSATRYLSDTAITTRVKAAFAKDAGVKGRHISVRTDQGVVDLDGTVGSQAESDRSTALAMQVESVKAVHNHLKIVLPGN